MLDPVGGSGLNARPVRKGAEGQALVEFALTLPFLILLFLVLVELGLLIRSHMTVTAAVREGVRVVSARGNAEPSIGVNASGEIEGGNDASARVGGDGDLALVQNVNTALNEERKNVILLMSYRADSTEMGGTAQDVVSNTTISLQIGQHGLGGAWGVYFNPAVSKVPFQEVYSYTVRNGQRWFRPEVLSTASCTSLYANTAPVKPAAATPAGNSYTQPFCGDLSKSTDTNGVSRLLPLGQKKTGVGDNATTIIGKERYPGATCRDDGTGNVQYAAAIQCWRYNFAPWYPALRRTEDVGLKPGNNPSVAGYYNTSNETAATFGGSNLGQAPDYTGVQINYFHPWLFTSFFPGPPLQLSDRAVKVMEPIGGSFTAPAPKP